MKLAIIALSTAALVASAPTVFAQGSSGKAPGQEMQEGFSTGQPRGIELRSRAGDARERQEREPGCFRLRAWPNQRLEQRWDEWSKLHDHKI